MLADALLRSVAGTNAYLRVTWTNADSSQSEVGILPTAFSQVVVSPVVMRRISPGFKAGEANRWELLVSATGVQSQVNALNLSSAQALFAMTLSVTIGEQEYLIESVASNEAFGQVYLYRLGLRQAGTQSL